MKNYHKQVMQTRARITAIEKRHTALVSRMKRSDEIMDQFEECQNEFEKRDLMKEAKELQDYYLKETTELASEIKRVKVRNEIDTEDKDIYKAYTNMCRVITRSCIMLYQREF